MLKRTCCIIGRSFFISLYPLNIHYICSCSLLVFKPFKLEDMLPTNLAHPMTVHFPIALLLVAFLFELLALSSKSNPLFSKIGFYLLLTGTLGAVAAVITGNLFTEEFTGPLGSVKETHEMFANITMWSAIIASLLRIFIEIKKNTNTTLKLIAFTTLLIAVIAVSITGYYGGSMVYDYMLPGK